MTHDNACVFHSCLMLLSLGPLGLLSTSDLYFQCDVNEDLWSLWGASGAGSMKPSMLISVFRFLWFPNKRSLGESWWLVYAELGCEGLSGVFCSQTFHDFCPTLGCVTAISLGNLISLIGIITTEVMFLAFCTSCFDRGSNVKSTDMKYKSSSVGSK